MPQKFAIFASRLRFAVDASRFTAAPKGFAGLRCAVYAPEGGLRCAVYGCASLRFAVDTSLLTAASQVESFVKNPRSVNSPKGINHEM
jgi:hypothetical protein